MASQATYAIKKKKGEEHTKNGKSDPEIAASTEYSCTYVIVRLNVGELHMTWTVAPSESSHNIEKSRWPIKIIITSLLSTNVTY